MGLTESTAISKLEKFVEICKIMSRTHAVAYLGEGGGIHAHHPADSKKVTVITHFNLNLTSIFFKPKAWRPIDKDYYFFREHFSIFLKSRIIEKAFEHNVPKFGVVLF